MNTVYMHSVASRTSVMKGIMTSTMSTQSTASLKRIIGAGPGAWCIGAFVHCIGALHCGIGALRTALLAAALCILHCALCTDALRIALGTVHCALHWCMGALVHCAWCVALTCRGCFARQSGVAKRLRQAGASGTGCDGTLFHDKLGLWPGWICGACSLQEELQQLDLMELAWVQWSQCLLPCLAHCVAGARFCAVASFFLNAGFLKMRRHCT